MYKELDKYKTGKKVPIEVTIAGKHPGTAIFNGEEYCIPMGELVLDLIKHTAKPFWKRNFYHNDLTEMYIGILNEIKITRSWL